jgi:hypothetical protein
LSLYCSLKTKLETAPLAVPRISQSAEELAGRADRLEADDERDHDEPDHEPSGLNAVNLGTAVEEWSEERDEHRHRGEQHARPEGTESSPSVMRMKGAAIASTPSRIAGRACAGCRRALRAPSPFDEHYLSRSPTVPVTAWKKATSTAEKSCSAYLMSIKAHKHKSA